MCETEGSRAEGTQNGRIAMRHIKNLTYHNLMAVIHKIERKGYDFETSERLARNIFAEFEAHPQGISIEKRIDMILDYEDWVRENEEARW